MLFPLQSHSLIMRFPHRIHYCPTNHQPHANILEQQFSSIPLSVWGPKSKLPLQSTQPLSPSGSKSSYKGWSQCTVKKRGMFSALNNRVNRCNSIYLDASKLKLKERLCSINNTEISATFRNIESYSSTFFSTRLCGQDLHTKRWSRSKPWV